MDDVVLWEGTVGCGGGGGWGTDERLPPRSARMEWGTPLVLRAHLCELPTIALFFFGKTSHPDLVKGVSQKSNERHARGREARRFLCALRYAIVSWCERV